MLFPLYPTIFEMGVKLEGLLNKLIASVLFSCSVHIIAPSTSNKIFFNGTSASLQITTATIPLKQGFDFKFRTCNGGALLYQASGNGFVQFEVNPGTVNFSNGDFVPSQLTFSWNMGNGENVIKLGKELDKNHEYTVMFTPGGVGTNSSVSVSDNGVNTFTAQVPNTILNFAGAGPLSAGPASQGGYIGCMESGTNIALQLPVAGISSAKAGCPLEQRVGCPKRGKLA